MQVLPQAVTLGCHPVYFHLMQGMPYILLTACNAKQSDKLQSERGIPFIFMILHTNAAALSKDHPKMSLLSRTVHRVGNPKRRFLQSRVR